MFAQVLDDISKRLRTLSDNHQLYEFAVEYKLSYATLRSLMTQSSKNPTIGVLDKVTQALDAWESSHA